MRIVYIGQDQFLGCARAALAGGHTISAIYSSPGERTQAVRELAKSIRAVLHTAPMTRVDLERESASGAELFLCAGYPRLVPVAPGEHAPAVNIHPALLPEGRGPAPMAWTILKGLTESGVTAHEMNERFDRGPIVVQQRITLSPRETAATLTARLGLLAAALTTDLLADFPALWAARTPQLGGSYWKAPRLSDRTIDWSAGVETIERTARAFPGRTFATIGGQRHTLTSAVGWTAAHGRQPGTAIDRWQGTTVVAAADGFVAVNARRITVARQAWWRISRASRRAR